MPPARATQEEEEVAAPVEAAREGAAAGPKPVAAGGAAGAALQRRLEPLRGAEVSLAASARAVQELPGTLRAARAALAKLAASRA